MNKAVAWHPVPLRLVDEVMPKMKDTELRVMLVVLRQTWGWKADRAKGSKSEGYRAESSKRKRRDWLSHSQLCRRTGRSSDAVSGAVASLVEAGLLVVEDAGGTALATPEQRRRCLGRLYFRPGDIWGGGEIREAVEL